MSKKPEENPSPCTCGGVNVKIKTWSPLIDKTKFYWVSCQDCGLNTGTRQKRTKLQAVATWNDHAEVAAEAIRYRKRAKDAEEKLLDIENAEGMICPEDVSFVEFIEHLQAQSTALREVTEEIIEYIDSEGPAAKEWEAITEACERAKELLNPTPPLLDKKLTEIAEDIKESEYKK